MTEPGQAPESAQAPSLEERSCEDCGASLSPDQDWCLSCGAGHARRVSGGAPGWRTAAVVGGSIAALLAGTAVAAVAALNHHPAHSAAAVAEATGPASSEAPPSVAPPTEGAPGEAPPTGASPAEAPAGEAPSTEETPASATTPDEIGTLATPQIKLPKTPPAKQTPPPKIPLESPTPPPAPPEASEGPSAGEEEAGEGLGAGSGTGPGGSEQGAGGGEPRAGGEPGAGAHGGGRSEPGGAGESGPPGPGEGEEGGGERGGGGEGGRSKQGGKGAPGKPGREAPEPLVLDTDAAAAFNPYRYPGASTEDPQLAIDGTHSTAWTATIEPAEYPAGELGPGGEGSGAVGTGTAEGEPGGGGEEQRTGEEPVGTATTPTGRTPAEVPGRVPTGPAGIGLTLDLEQSQRVSRLLLSSSTPGMTFAVYGAESRRAPTGAPDAPASAWTTLASPRALHGSDARVTLSTDGRRWRWVLLWIVSAPETPPTGRSAGEVSVNEVELLESPGAS